MATKKYRPYFTEPQLKLLHSVIAKECIENKTLESAEIEVYLRRYLRDISEDFLAPSITTVGNKQTTAEKLGMSELELILATIESGGVSALSDKQIEYVLTTENLVIDKKIYSIVNEEYMKRMGF